MLAFLLRVSRVIDRINTLIGRAAVWLVLVAVLISAGNAVVRKALNISSKAWLELQWYLFGGMFLLAAGYTLLANEHVRVDVLAQKLPKRTQIMLEIFILFFLAPACVLLGVLSWPVFVDAYVTNEQSSNTGGLVRWPVKLLIPVGFALLFAAGLSQLIKCIAFLQGRAPDPTLRDKPGGSDPGPPAQRGDGHGS